MLVIAGNLPQVWGPPTWHGRDERPPAAECMRVFARRVGAQCGCPRLAIGYARPAVSRTRRASASRVTAASNTPPMTRNLIEEDSASRSIPLLIEVITRAPVSA